MIKSTTIRLDGVLKDKLAEYGGKKDSYGDIILNIIHERDILAIHDYLQDGMDGDLRDVCKKTFQELNIHPKLWFISGDKIDRFPTLDHALEWACEMANDEDLVGHNRNPSLAEAVTNVYCLLEEIPAPTWSNGAMRNPLAP